MAETHDPYAFIVDSSHISYSQEQLLHHTPFVGSDTLNNHETPSPPGIVMLSAPETQDGVVFHTPPEDSSLPTSDHHRSNATPAVNHDFCAYSDGSEFVDLGRDSEIGFSEAQLEEFGVLERGFSDLGDSPPQKSKLSDHGLGFGSSGDFFGVQSQKVEDGKGESSCNIGENVENCCKEISMDKDLDSGGNFEAKVVQLEMIKSDTKVNTLGSMVERNNSSDGIVEASGMRHVEPGMRVLPSSIRGLLEDAASGLECGKDGKKKKRLVLGLLKVLSENSHENEDDLDNLSLFEVAKLRGITFPRPRWWPDSMDSTNKNSVKKHFKK